MTGAEEEEEEEGFLTLNNFRVVLKIYQTTSAGSFCFVLMRNRPHNTVPHAKS